ncbi:MAG TPA: peptidoglycan recognition family protein [Micromonospora sp.]
MPEKFVSKEEWGSTLGHQATPASHPIGATHGVTLHWEGPHMGDFPHSACAGKVRGIERFHEQTRGWADLAYSAVVCPHGFIFEGRGVGTMTAANGDTDTNDDWYAVCYLGGTGDGFTEAGKAGMHAAVTWLRAKGGAGRQVNGHRDHKATACPGDEIYRWLNAHNFDTEEDDEMNADDGKRLGTMLDNAATKAAERAVEKFLDEPINKHHPDGDPDFRKVTVREAIKRAAKT